jgi:hypothetical protein
MTSPFAYGNRASGNQFFTDIGTIRVGGVDEVDVQFYCAAQNRKRSAAIIGSAPDAFTRESHRSETET